MTKEELNHIGEHLLLHLTECGRKGDVDIVLLVGDPDTGQMKCFAVVSNEDVVTAMLAIATTTVGNAELIHQNDPTVN